MCGIVSSLSLTSDALYAGFGTSDTLTHRLFGLALYLIPIRFQFFGGTCNLILINSPCFLNGAGNGSGAVMSIFGPGP